MTPPDTESPHPIPDIILTPDVTLLILTVAAIAIDPDPTPPPILALTLALVPLTDTVIALLVINSFFRCFLPLLSFSHTNLLHSLLLSPDSYYQQR